MAFPLAPSHLLTVQTEFDLDEDDVQQLIEAVVLVASALPDDRRRACVQQMLDTVAQPLQVHTSHVCSRLDIDLVHSPWHSEARCTLLGLHASCVRSALRPTALPFPAAADAAPAAAAGGGGAAAAVEGADGAGTAADRPHHDHLPGCAGPC